MIIHGRKQISEMVYARKASEGGGAVRLTNMIRGGAVVFGGLEPKVSWLTIATRQAIVGAFGVVDGTAVIKATNAYLNGIAATDPTKAQALADYINQHPRSAWGCYVGRHISISSQVWQVSPDRTNPDPDNTFGLYESARRRISSAWDVIEIHVWGKAGQFTLLMTSWAEANYDMAYASVLDPTTFSTSSFKARTNSNNKPSTDIANYMSVVYDIPDENEHVIKVAYRTDGGAWPNDDRAFLLIPYASGFMDQVTLLNETFPPSNQTP